MSIDYNYLKKYLGNDEIEMPKNVKAIFNVNSNTKNTQYNNHCINNIKINELKMLISKCKNCGLRYTDCHINKVPGVGNCNSNLIIVGDVPGTKENIIGEPFVDNAGILLTRILNKLNIKRDSIYITNIIKCKPPGNRKPLENEVLNCSKILNTEILMIKPKVIISLGDLALSFFKKNSKIMRDRGNWIIYKNIPVMPTYHPEFLLKINGEIKKQLKWNVWNDFNLAIEKLNSINSAKLGG